LETAEELARTWRSPSHQLVQPIPGQVLECTRWTFHPFYNGSTVLLGDLVDDAFHSRSIQSLAGSTGAVEQRTGQRVPSMIRRDPHFVPGRI